MVLSLITPQGTDFMKNFPSQNAVNLDRVDEYAGPCLPSQGIRTYTPIWTATTTSPTLGTGSIMLGYYYRIFDQCWVWGECCLGTAGAARGSGTYEISLPFKAKFLTAIGGALTNSPPVIGNAQAFDLSDVTQRQPLLTVLRSATTMAFSVRFASGGATRRVTETIPWTFNGGDGIMFSARFQVDPT